MPTEYGQKKRYRIFINPYHACAFTKCPRCVNKTNVRKFPLVVHVKPKQMILLNMECKYCTHCDLIIVRQITLDKHVNSILQQFIPSLVGNEYVVFGTVDRKVWRNSRKESLDSSDMINHVYVFEDKLEFVPAG